MRERTRLCTLCGCLIPNERNNNSKFCSNACYRQNKATLAKAASKKFAEERALYNNDQILKQLFQVHGDNEYISAELLIAQDFHWSIAMEDMIIDGCRAKRMINYCFSLFQNQTIRVWKI